MNNTPTMDRCLNLSGPMPAVGRQGRAHPSENELVDRRGCAGARRRGSKMPQWHRLLAVGSLALSAGCAGSDPTGPTDPTFPALVVTTTSLPGGAANVAYATQTVTAAGGDGSYSWTVVSGRPPAGLSVASNGVVTGTPTAVGTGAFTIQATSGDGQTAQRALSIAVGAPPALRPDELCSDHPAYARASFEDPNLEAAVREELSLDPQDAVTCGMLATIDVLDAPSLGIASLEGIQNLTDLVGLGLGDNEITDLSALSGLTSLMYVSLFHNTITDISALSALTDLQFLNLNFNGITDATALSGLTDLEILFLGNNSIGDIGALRRLTRLSNLSLESNPITDIGALRELTGLTDLRLGTTSIADYGPLGALTALESLALPHNSIDDLTSLAALLRGHAALRNLSLSDNSITDIDALGELTGLTYLGLSGNSLTDVSVLSGLADLDTLFLTENSITDVTALNGLTSLRYVGLSDNPDLDDIQPLLDNPGFGAGVSVTLLRTNVGCTDVAALRAKDVTVHASACP